MRLKIKLFEGWKDYSNENPDGPPTFFRDLSENSGALQISWAEYKGGKPPNSSLEELESFAISFGRERSFGELIESFHDSCEFGKMGSSIFQSSEYPRIQIWQISNGKDFIMVTHIFSAEPNRQEILEAQQIVRNVILH